jgi:hypothetical protein
VLRSLLAHLQPAHATLSTGASAQANSNSSIAVVTTATVKVSAIDDDGEFDDLLFDDGIDASRPAKQQPPTTSDVLHVLLLDERWQVCFALPSTTSVYQAFAGSGALLAMQCLSAFIEK